MMKLAELKSALAKKPAAELRFQLANGNFVPVHAHVTEVARVDKTFVDCGGTLRAESVCRLQTWFADDLDHRLTAGKLLKIFAKAENFLPSEELEVEVEHEIEFISQFPLVRVAMATDRLILHLGLRHTACLAMDKCLPPAAPSEFNPLKFNFKETPSVSKCCA